MKNLLVFIICVVLSCQNQESPPKSLVDKVAELCRCQNSEGKTIETRAREVLGQDFYLAVNSAETFSEALENHPDKLEVLSQTIEIEFLKDENYKKCAKQSLKSIDFERNLAKEGTNILVFFNEKKEYTIYRMLPFLITYLQKDK